MATFITSKSVGQTMNIYVQTSTGFWKYNHDGSDSSVFGNGQQNITITNANGEFTIISCLSDGTVSGDITQLNLGNNLLTSFDGTSLTSLTNLNLYNNQLTSLVGFIFPTSLTTLQLGNNQLTSFDATGLPNLVGLVLLSNPLTPSVNNQILNQLNQHGLSGGYFESNNGRTSASITDYNNLVSLGWEFSGLQIISVGNGKLRVKGFRPTPQWDGGTIYNIGAVVTLEGQTWHCIQYAPSGYGPFGGYIDVYWTL